MRKVNDKIFKILFTFVLMFIGMMNVEAEVWHGKIYNWNELCDKDLGVLITYGDSEKDYSQLATKEINKINELFDKCNDCAIDDDFTCRSGPVSNCYQIGKDNKYTGGCGVSQDSITWTFPSGVTASNNETTCKAYRLDSYKLIASLYCSYNTVNRNNCLACSKYDSAFDPAKESWCFSNQTGCEPLVEHVNDPTNLEECQAQCFIWEDCDKKCSEFKPGVEEPSGNPDDSDDSDDSDDDYEYQEGCASLGRLQGEIMNIYEVIQVVLAIGLVVITVFDFAKAVTASDVEKAKKKAMSNFGLRIFIYILLLLAPSLVSFILNALGLGEYVCF